MLTRYLPQSIYESLIHSSTYSLLLALNQRLAENEHVGQSDANKEALEQVEQITESNRDNGEDLLESEDLKRQLREARERVGLPKPSRQEPVE